MKETEIGQVHKKLITVTRRDLLPGYQAVQAAHSAIEFQYQFPDIAKQWNEQSKYLVFLSIENEIQLKKLIEKANTRKIKFTIFKEPDINNQITSITFEPSKESQRLCSNLSLMLKK